jgi:hypothetical protein
VASPVERPQPRTRSRCLYPFLTRSKPSTISLRWMNR